MSTVALYVGADNDTGYLDMPRIENIVGKHHEAFTVWPAAGHWQGEAEDSAVVLISDQLESIRDTALALKGELRQDAIGMQVMPDMEFV